MPVPWGEYLMKAWVGGLRCWECRGDLLHGNERGYGGRAFITCRTHGCAQYDKRYAAPTVDIVPLIESSPAEVLYAEYTKGRGDFLKWESLPGGYREVFRWIAERIHGRPSPPHREEQSQ